MSIRGNSVGGLLPTAEQVGALSTLGGTMDGPINMGGNVIWGLGNPTGYDQPVPYRMFLDDLAKKANLINRGDYTGSLDIVGDGGVPLNSVVWVTPSNSPDGNWGWVETFIANSGGSVQRYTSTNANIYARCRYDNSTGVDWHCGWTRVDGLDKLPLTGGTVNGPVNINGPVTMAGNVSYSGGDINMNSRKIWNLALPTSSQDAVNKAYVDDLYAKNRKAIDDVVAGKIQKFSLLWQNASPNSLFGAQTISVDLSSYDTVMIVYNQYYENYNVAVCFAPKFCYGQLETVMTGGRYRTLFVGNEGVTFENQLMADGSAGSNNFCIPTQIFGCDFS